MRRWNRRAGALACLAVTLVLSGCDLSWITVQIPDFNSKKVRGVWVSRQVEGTTTWKHDVRIDFERITTGQGVEWMEYETVVGPAGQRAVTTALLQRTAGKPDEVKLSLGFLRLSAPGYFRVSTYNASGESPLSSTSKRL